MDVAQGDFEYVVSALNLSTGAVQTDYEHNGSRCVAITVAGEVDALRLFFKIGRAATHYVSEENLFQNLEVVDGEGDELIIVFPNVHVLTTDSIGVGVGDGSEHE